MNYFTVFRFLAILHLFARLFSTDRLFPNAAIKELITLPRRHYRENDRYPIFENYTLFSAFGFDFWLFGSRSLCIFEPIF